MSERHPSSIEELHSAVPDGPAEHPAELAEDTEIAPRATPDRAPTDVERDRPPLEYGSASAKSERKGKANEDRVLADTRRGLYGVFDGMGGHAAGEIAAKRAEELVLLGCPENRTVNTNGDLAVSRLTEVVKDASTEIFEEPRAVPELEGMGTTLSLLQIIRDAESGLPREAIIANVGDSRWYRLRSGRLEQLTTDDTLIQGLIDGGILPPEVDQVGDPRADAMLTPEQRAKALTERNVVSQSIGDEGPITPRILRVPIEAGDTYLATTDGIHDNLLASEIEAIAQQHAEDPDAMAAALVAAAGERARERRAALDAKKPVEGPLARGKDDDRSAIALRVNAVHAEAPRNAPPGEVIPPAPRAAPTEHTMDMGEADERRSLPREAHEEIVADVRHRDRLEHRLTQVESDLAWHEHPDERDPDAVLARLTDHLGIKRAYELAIKDERETETPNPERRAAILRRDRTYKEQLLHVIDGYLDALEERGSSESVQQ